MDRDQASQKLTDGRTQLLMPQQLARGFAEGLSGQSSGSLIKIWNYRENTALGVFLKDFPQRTLQEWELAHLHGLEFQTA